jgi:hypothetical protein
MANPLKKITSSYAPSADPVSDQTRPVAAVNGVHAGHASPARDLMSRLEADLTVESVVEDKYSLKWTVLGVTLFCGLSWYAIFSLIF